MQETFFIYEDFILPMARTSRMARGRMARCRVARWHADFLDP